MKDSGLVGACWSLNARANYEKRYMYLQFYGRRENLTSAETRQNTRTVNEPRVFAHLGTCFCPSTGNCMAVRTYVMLRTEDLISKVGFLTLYSSGRYGNLEVTQAAKLRFEFGVIQTTGFELFLSLSFRLYSTILLYLPFSPEHHLCQFIMPRLRSVFSFYSHPFFWFLHFFHPTFNECSQTRHASLTRQYRSKEAVNFRPV
jgi:hypothetical protein